jgi:drug/metabolite transporter (DMT)-like permease
MLNFFHSSLLSSIQNHFHMLRYSLLVFAGACSFGILSTFVKLSYHDGYTPAQISFSQAVVGMLALTLLTICTRQDGAIWRMRRAILPVLITGISIGLTTNVYYVSVSYIPASVAIIVLMQFVWISVLIDKVIFRTPVTKLQLLSILLILIGTMMASGVYGFHATMAYHGILWALGSAFLYAVYIIASSKTGGQLPVLARSTVLMTGSAIGIFLFNSSELISSIHTVDEGLLRWAIFLGIFGTIIPPVLFSIGIPRIGSVMSSIIMTAELPVAVFCSSLILGESVTFLQWSGVTLMLASIAILKLAGITPIK